MPGEPATLAARQDLPGLVVVRSLTKTWGLAGLRVGYLLGHPDLVARLARAQPPWPVNSLALEALVACSQPDAVVWAQEQARRTAGWRASLAAALDRLPASPWSRVARRRSCWSRSVTRPWSGPGCAASGSRSAAATPSPAWAPTGPHRRGRPEHHDRILDGFARSLTGAWPVPAPVAPPTPPNGRVTLVGAGPGGADLITLRGWRALHAADVVVTDRLADPGSPPSCAQASSSSTPASSPAPTSSARRRSPRPSSPMPRRPACGPPQGRRPVRVRPRR